MQYLSGAATGMPLVLALKNRHEIVVASDSPVFGHSSTERFGALMPLPNRCVLLLSGNIEIIRSVIMETVLPHILPSQGAAALAQVIHAALVLEIAPKLPHTKGRIEVIVAGIDPVRHIEEPGLYYMDSAQDFQLQIAPGDAVMAGATAAITSLSQGSFADASTDQLKVLAKECLSATKLRWPDAIGSHLTLGVITAQSTQFISI